jgi:outer membrane protein TolC
MFLIWTPLSGQTARAQIAPIVEKIMQRQEQTQTGSERAPDATTLSLEQAIQLAIENNLNTKLADERRSEALGRKLQALAALMPDVSAKASQSNNTVNIAAQGLRPGLLPIGSSFIGPFDSFDARFQLAQTIFSLSSIRRFQSARADVDIAASEIKLAREQVASMAALAYLETLRAQRGVETAQANLELAHSLLTLARNQKNAGVATGVDVTRAETRVAEQQVRLAQAETSEQTAMLQLLRVTGLPLGGAPLLIDSLTGAGQPAPDIEQALQSAAQDRVEIEIASQQVRRLDYEYKAARAALYPTIDFVAAYGSSGTRMNTISLPTRSVGVQVNIPIFNGGATWGKIKSARSREVQAELRLKDTRDQVEQDVRQTIQTLTAAIEQARAAEQEVLLAERELQQSRDRFAAGVGDNIEVLNAQTSLANAQDAQIAALTAYNAARINLAAAMGAAERFRWQ